MNELRLESATWEGDGRTVDFLDFVIDDQSLFDWIRWCSEDPDPSARNQRVTPFSRTLPAKARKAAHRRLILRDPPDVDGRWTSVYVCPLCGDLGCGAVAVEVVGAGDRIRWDSVVKVGAMGPPRVLTPGPFEFEQAAYLDALVSALAM